MLTITPRRSSLKIYTEILTEIKNGEVLPTRIMYKTATSWNMLRKILESLKAQGLIENQTLEGNKKSKNTYTITNKGNNALNYLNKVNDVMNLDLGLTTLIL